MERLFDFTATAAGPFRSADDLADAARRMLVTTADSWAAAGLCRLPPAGPPRDSRRGAAPGVSPALRAGQLRGTGFADEFLVIP